MRKEKQNKLVWVTEEVHEKLLRLKIDIKAKSISEAINHLFDVREE